MAERIVTEEIVSASVDAERKVSVRVENPAYSSVEISTDSKGNVKPSVKVYDVDPERAARRALEIFRYITDEIARAS